VDRRSYNRSYCTALQTKRKIHRRSWTAGRTQTGSRRRPAGR
jgi:hypothetical protein